MTEASFQENIQNYIQDKKFYIRKYMNILIHLLIILKKNIFQDLIQVINDQKIKETKYDLQILLNIIVKISNNFNRYSTFFERITKILAELKETLKQTYTNHELFNTFKNNKILLLFLFKEEMITMDKYIKNIMESKKYEQKQYPSCFAPEIARNDESEVSDELFNKDPKIFEENRKNGENISEIAVLHHLCQPK